ncbi:MAG: IS3 family transposase [Vallitaleaceae bacterium]|nr:IS3 family transposase [Vallitaleaceae bacterium]
MCKVFGYSKQAFYKQLHTAENTAAKEATVVGLIQQKRTIWKRGSGRNLHKSLQPQLASNQIKMGRDKFFDLLRDNHLLIRPKRHRTKTTCSYHHFRKYANLIQNIVPTSPDQVWVADITYLWLKQQDKFCYLSIITDLYSRKIVGHCVHDDLSVKGCMEALQQAIKARQNNTPFSLTHHSDRGVQYCCHAYVRMLKKHKINISMTQSGDPLENPVAERINKTIKEEFTLDRQINFCNLATAKNEIRKFIEFYNRQRPHRSVQWLTPNEAHQRTGELKRAWKSYYRKTTQGGDLEKALAEK